MVCLVAVAVVAERFMCGECAFCGRKQLNKIEFFCCNCSVHRAVVRRDDRNTDTPNDFRDKNEFVFFVCFGMQRRVGKC